MKFPSISPILKFILKFFCAILFRLVNVCFRWTRWGGAYASPLCTPLFQTDSPTVNGYFGSVWVKETQGLSPNLSNNFFLYNYFQRSLRIPKIKTNRKFTWCFFFLFFVTDSKTKNIKTFFFILILRKINKYVFPSFWVFSKKTTCTRLVKNLHTIKTCTRLGKVVHTVATCTTLGKVVHPKTTCIPLFGYVLVVFYGH